MLPASCHSGRSPRRSLFAVAVSLLMVPFGLGFPLYMKLSGISALLNGLSAHSFGHQIPVQESTQESLSVRKDGYKGLCS